MQASIVCLQLRFHKTDSEFHSLVKWIVSNCSAGFHQVMNILDCWGQLIHGY